MDACRTPKGELLLVELEDLNPYLSLDLLDSTTRDAFVSGLAAFSATPVHSRVLYPARIPWRKVPAKSSTSLVAVAVCARSRKTSSAPAATAASA